MENTETKTLYYDAECPMCVAYTAVFIKTGRLQEGERKVYGQFSEEEQAVIDTDRARNEIALYDRKNNQVYYGLDSLYTLVFQNTPMLKKVFEWAPIKAFFRVLYSFISYNRKVIVPTANPHACRPDYHTGYRLAFVFLGNLMVIPLAAMMASQLWPATLFHIQPMLFYPLSVGLMLLQCSIVAYIDKKQVLEYAGQLTVTRIIAVGCALPALWMPMYLQPVFIAIAGVMLITEHIRRLRIISLPSWLTWVYVAMAATVFISKLF